MITTRSATGKQRRSCRQRNDNRPMGWQPSIMAKWKYKRLEKDVAAGILPKSCLNVTMRIFGKGKKQ